MTKPGGDWSVSYHQERPSPQTLYDSNVLYRSPPCSGVRLLGSGLSNRKVTILGSGDMEGSYKHCLPTSTHIV